MSSSGESPSGISIRNLSFAYGDKPLFDNLNLVPGKGNPLVILGPSGCGKTTLLKLLAGLLRPDAGEIDFARSAGTGACSFIFQEPRLLPRKTVLENVMLPVEQSLGKTGAEERARHFLRQVSLEDRAPAFPGELSGGQKQRVSFARAFAFPGRAILMDEPFQSLDIPLRIQLMDLARSLLAESPRPAIIVTHDPREAVYLGQRILALGQPPAGFVFDETPVFEPGERVFGSAAQLPMERRLIEVLGVPGPAQG